MMTGIVFKIFFPTLLRFYIMNIVYISLRYIKWYYEMMTTIRLINISTLIVTIFFGGGLIGFKVS